MSCMCIKFNKYQFYKVIKTMFLFLLTSFNLYTQDYWQKTSLDNFSIYGFAEDSKGNIYTCGVKTPRVAHRNGMGIYKSSDNGFSWTYLGLSELINSISTIYIDNNDIIFVGVDGLDYSLYRSTDFGHTWQLSNTGLRSNLGSYPRVYQFTINSKDELFGVCDFGIMKTTNKGNTWTIINQSEKGISSSIHCDSKDNIIMASDSDIYLYNEDDDSSEVKVILKCPIGICMFRGSTINSKDRVFATGNAPVNTIYSDDKKNWYELKINNHLFNSSFIFCDKEDNIYVQTTKEDFKLGRFIDSFFKSSDDGKTWTNIKYNFPDSISISRVFVSKKGYMFIGTTQNGVYRSTSTIVGIDDAKRSTDIIITPNPAIDYIEINLNNHTLKGVVEIVRVFDLLGVSVITSPPAPLHSGEGSKVRLDVSHLPPGVYFVQIGSRVQRFVKI